jgi:hypothetical protein
MLAGRIYSLSTGTGTPRMPKTAWAVGIIAIAWPGVTILALVILFAIYAFIDAGPGRP